MSTAPLFPGVLFPSILPMVIRWSCKEEQAKFAALSGMGGTFGSIFIFPLCGLIISKWGWPSVFYVSGLVSLIWCLFWAIFITDDPTQSGFISKQELQMVLKKRSGMKITNQDTYKIVMNMLRNPGVLAYFFSAMANDWGMATMLVEGPNFINHVLHKVTIRQNYLQYVNGFVFHLNDPRENSHPA